MEYKLKLNDRPFNAIKKGTKKVEGRTLTKYDKTPYDKMKSGDEILFINNKTRESMKVTVKFVNHYSDVRAMLLSEGTKNVLSSNGGIGEGIKSYNKFKGCKAGILKNGIYAIGIRK